MNNPIITFIAGPQANHVFAAFNRKLSSVQRHFQDIVGVLARLLRRRNQRTGPKH